jgi:hypothetical protein
MFARPNTPRKHHFVVKKDQVVLSNKVLNDKLLQDNFSEPMVLDTRQFHLLHYGMDKIYNQVDEEKVA